MSGDAPRAADLLQAARTRYAASERGSTHALRTVEFAPPVGAVSRRGFVITTSWSRPQSVLRVEWGERSEAAGGLLVNEQGREVVVARAGEVDSWPLGAEKAWRCSSLVAALADDAGGGAALLASLVRPDAFAGAARLGAAVDGAAAAFAERIEGVECWRVALVRPTDGEAGVAQEAWFEQGSLELRLLIERQELGGGTITTTTTLHPLDAASGAPSDGPFVLGPPTDALRVALFGTEVASGAAAAGAFGLATAALLIALLLKRRRRT